MDVLQIRFMHSRRGGPEPPREPVSRIRSHGALLVLWPAVAMSQPATDAVDVAVRNLAGHKLPTAHPSRRAWLHVQVRDAAGALVFESGSMRHDGSVEGNDDDARAVEPHYTEITAPDQVQIYESMIAGEPQRRERRPGTRARLRDSGE